MVSWACSKYGVDQHEMQVRTCCNVCGKLLRT